MNSAADKNNIDAFSRELSQYLQRITGKVLEPEDLPLPVVEQKLQEDTPEKAIGSPETKSEKDAKNEQTT
ncbi:MAG: hypothetical protein AB1894_07315 [Chloroflexota bacterium]